MSTHRKKRSIGLFTTIALFLGSREHVSGWWVMGVLFFFMWLFLGNVDYSVFYLWGDVVEVQGEFTHNETIYTKIMENSWYENHYKFRTPDGNEWVDFSYSDTVGKGKGHPATIIYPAGKPHMSRVKDMRRDTLSPYYLFFLLFPALGLVNIIMGVFVIGKYVSMLKRGNIVEAEVISTSTKKDVEGGVEYTYLKFAFEDENGERQIVEHETVNPEELKDDARELIMYPPGEPKKFIPVDSIPTKVFVDDKGRISIGSHKRTIKGIIVPLVFLAIHGALAGWIFKLFQ